MAARRMSVAAFRRDQRGNATIEFVILFPLLFYILISMGEAGAMMARSVMLERGLDIAVREIRLGILPNGTDEEIHDHIKAQICDAAFLIGDCERNLLVEIVPLADPNGVPVGPANCIDRMSEVDPVLNVTPGTASEIMFVRACIVLDPIFPASGLGALLPVDESGGYSIVTQSAFMNEP